MANFVNMSRGFWEKNLLTSIKPFTEKPVLEYP